MTLCYTSRSGPCLGIIRETFCYRKKQTYKPKPDIVVRKRNQSLKQLFPSHFFLQATVNRMEDDVNSITARLY